MVGQFLFVLKPSLASKKVSKKDSLETSSHWETCWEPHKRKGAVLRGIQFIFKLAQEQENFTTWGSHEQICKRSGFPVPDRLFQRDHLILTPQV